MSESYCRSCGWPLSLSDDDGMALLGFCNETCLCNGDDYERRLLEERSDSDDDEDEA